MSQTAAVILAAGQGIRMKSALPKVLHPLAGRAMIDHVRAALAPLEPARAVVVIGPDMDAVAAAVAPLATAVQAEPLGTADAVKAARRALSGFEGTVLVLFGDTPLITTETLEALVAEQRRLPELAVVVLGFRPQDPGAYGRLVIGDDGALEAIVEARDASAAELAIPLCNSGVMAIDGAVLFALLERIGNDNAKGEYYLTDIVAMARSEGRAAGHIEASEYELLGVNSRSELALAEQAMQWRLREAAMAAGATLADPATVYLSYDTRLGQDVVVGPHVVFGRGVEVGDGAEIRGFCHIEGARIAPGAAVGPFARLRRGSEIGQGARVGNFVEVKNATLEAGAKANHLAYIGDARVGADANVGAGTITCNYDGFMKSHTDIGAGVFIGSNSALVAPVSIGDGAVIGAGSVITQDVEADALAITRPAQDQVAGWARKYRERKQAEAAARKAEKKAAASGRKRKRS